MRTSSDASSTSSPLISNVNYLPGIHSGGVIAPAMPKTSVMPTKQLVNEQGRMIEKRGGNSIQEL